MSITIILAIIGTFFEYDKYIYTPCTGIAYEKNDYAIYFTISLL
jgi:hypothetical protein